MVLKEAHRTFGVDFAGEYAPTVERDVEIPPPRRVDEREVAITGICVSGFIPDRRARCVKPRCVEYYLYVVGDAVCYELTVIRVVRLDANSSPSLAQHRLDGDSYARKCGIGRGIDHERDRHCICGYTFNQHRGGICASWQPRWISGKRKFHAFKRTQGARTCLARNNSISSNIFKYHVVNSRRPILSRSVEVNKID